MTPSPGTAACVTNPQFGATGQSGLQTGNDTAVDGGRPMWPVLYLTDISFDKDNRSGDWQSGSTVGIPAEQVCGVWTTGVRRVYTHLGNTVTIAMDPSPSPNNWNLGAGSAVPPGGFGAYPDQGYGAEVSWDLSHLPLVAGHRYRLYTMIHDGDQSAADGGESATPHGVVVPQNGDHDGGVETDRRGKLAIRPGGPCALRDDAELPEPFRSVRARDPVLVPE